MTTMTETQAKAVKVGDIFYTSWGYDQTNVDFYEVLSVTPSGKSVKVRQIASRLSDDERGVVPVPGTTVSYNGEPMLKKLKSGPALKVASYATAWLWDGTPKYDTCATGGMGH
jgi:hypothetical protein